MTESTYGKRVGLLKATPIKRALLNDARKLHLDDALGEIIDNAIDNHAKQQQLGRAVSPLVVDIRLDEDAVTIRESSGGVTPEDLLAFVQLGASGSAGESPHIGVWGQGQKLAMAALGRDATIKSRYWDPKRMYELEEQRTDQVLLRMDEQWWDSQDNWDVPVYVPDGELTAGETVYEIRKLNQLIDDGARKSVRKELGELYGDFLHEATATIRIDGEALEANPIVTERALADELAYPPGFEPSRHLFQLHATQPVIEGGVRRDEQLHLEMEIIVGLSPRQDVSAAGVYMFGVPATVNGARLGPRKFVKEPLQDESVGYTTGPNSILRRGHATLGRLRVYVIFRGRSEDIPWGMPGSAVKRGYNAMNPFANQIREKIIEVAKPYARFTSKAREIDVVPYSAEWNGYDDERRRSIVRRGARIEMDELNEADIKPRVKPLLVHEFAPKSFIVWDHEAEPKPPVEAPALDLELSKQYTVLISDRDKRLKELDGLDPTAQVDELLATIKEIETRQGEGWGVEEGEAPGVDRMTSVTIRIRQSTMKRLAAIAGTTNKTDALMAAIDYYLRDQA